MKIKNNKKKILNFNKANEKLVFEIFRALQEVKISHPNIIIKIMKS